MKETVFLLLLLGLVAHCAPNSHQEHRLALNAKHDPRSTQPTSHKRELLEADWSLASPQQLLVHLEGPITQGLRTDLENIPGLVILGYVPQHTYLVRCDHAACVREVADHSSTIRVYKPNLHFKIAPHLLTRLKELKSQKLLHVESVGANDRVTLSVRAPNHAEHGMSDLTGLLLPASARAHEHDVQIRPVSSDKLYVTIPRVAARDVAIAIAEHEFVQWIEEPAKFHLLNVESQWIIQSFDEDRRPIWASDITGKDEVVTVADTGVSTDTCMWNDEENEAPFGTTTDKHRKIVAYKCDTAEGGHDCGDTHGHGTHVATTIAGSVTDKDRQKYPSTSRHEGMAPGAKLAVFDMSRFSDGSLDSPEDLNKGLFPWSYQETSSRIFSASWGEDSHNYTMASLEADTFSHEHRDWLVVLACGNDGQMQDEGGFFQIVPPGNAKNSLAVASSAAQPMSKISDISSFSSTGPTPDGRIKPDIVVPGESILSGSMRRQGYCSTTMKSGTSMSAPCAAGAAALVRQYYRHGFYPSGVATLTDVMASPTAALIKATLIASAQPLVGTAHTVDHQSRYKRVPIGDLVPDVYQGFGILRLDRILKTPLAGVSAPEISTFVHDAHNPQEGELLVTGEDREYCFHSVSASEDMPFSATLVWTDPPPAMVFEIALVNNLDLRVHSADGIWTGNFELMGDSNDNLNTVERVRLPEARPGAYLVTVKASHVPQGPQAYALVVAGKTLAYDKSGAACAAVELSCPHDCSGHGSCIRGHCQCDPGFTGATCAVASVALQLSSSVSSTPPVALQLNVKAWQWAFAHIDVDPSTLQGSAGEATSSSLTFSVTTHNRDSDPDVYVASARLPTLTDFDGKDDTQRVTSVVHAAVKGGDSGLTRIYVGVYGYCCVPEFNVSIVVTSAACSADQCFNGDCIEGTCKCIAGWEGGNCGTRSKDQLNDVVVRKVTSSAVATRRPTALAALVTLVATTVCIFSVLL